MTATPQFWSPRVPLQDGWQFIESRNLVVAKAGPIASVTGTVAEGVLLASAPRLLSALDQLEQMVGRMLDEADKGDPSASTLAAVRRARVVAAMAVTSATEPTAH